MPAPIECPAPHGKLNSRSLRRWFCRFGWVTTLLSSVACSVSCGSGSASPPTSKGVFSADQFSENPNNTVLHNPDTAQQKPRAKSGPKNIEPTRRGNSQLASSTNDRYLIIHADDAGLCRSVNKATIEAMERGVVSSASMMVPAPAFEEFAKYAREHPERDFGIHLTLNAEFESHRWGPVLPKIVVPGLVDHDGCLWQTERQTAAHATADEVERELTAQIEHALALGVPISHLDTHMGTCFARADFLEVYVNLGLKYKLPVLVMRNTTILRQFPAPQEVIRGMKDIARTLENNQLPVLDSVNMYYAGGSAQQKRSYYFNLFRTLPAGVTEAIVHCGYADRDLYSVTRSASIRDSDRQVMTDPETARELSRLGVKVIDWKQFRKMANREIAEKPEKTKNPDVKKVLDETIDATEN